MALWGPVASNLEQRLRPFQDALSWQVLEKQMVEVQGMARARKALAGAGAPAWAYRIPGVCLLFART